MNLIYSSGAAFTFCEDFVYLLKNKNFLLL